MSMNLLELRFYPIEGKEYGFKVSVEGSFGEVAHEPMLPSGWMPLVNLQNRFITQWGKKSH